MTDYLGRLTIGGSTASTYCLTQWEPESGGLTIAAEIVVTAATSDALAVAVEALVAQLAAGNTYVRNWPGSSYSLAYSVEDSSAIQLSGKDSWGSHWKRVGFTLAVSSPAGALTTLYDAQHVDAPASLALSSSLLGTHPPALDLTIDDQSGAGMHLCAAAIAPKAVTDPMWLVLASALTWTTMSSGTGADCWGNVSRTTTSSDWQTASLDTAMYPAGKYRLYVRAKQSAGTGYVRESQSGTEVAITRTSMHLTPVADLDLPAQDTAYGTAAPLVLSCASDGANTLTVNAFVLLPLSWGVWTWHHDVVTGECDQLDVGPSGLFVDGVCDTTYLVGGILTPSVLAAHVGTLVATASPSGNTWPTDWGTVGSPTADTDRFKFSQSTGQTQAFYAATNAATPLVVPGAWYELSFTRQVSAWTSGSAEASIRWQDVDGGTVREDTLSTVAAADASPLSVVVYGRAPAHAARAQVRIGVSSGAVITAYFSSVVLRRCPMRLIVVAEDSGGTLSTYVHPVHVTARYTPLYEVAR